MWLCIVTSGLMAIVGIWEEVILCSSIRYMRQGKGTSSGVSPSCWAVSYSSCSADNAVMSLAV